jgi:hypothetical protein
LGGEAVLPTEFVEGVSWDKEIGGEGVGLLFFATGFLVA